MIATSVVATYPVRTAPDRAVCGLGRKGVHAAGRGKVKNSRRRLGWSRLAEPVRTRRPPRVSRTDSTEAAPPTRGRGVARLFAAGVGVAALRDLIPTDIVSSVIEGAASVPRFARRERLPVAGREHLLSIGEAIVAASEELYEFSEKSFSPDLNFGLNSPGSGVDRRAGVVSLFPPTTTTHG